MVIDLLFIPTELSLWICHQIQPDIRGISDHTPLLFELLTLDFEVTKFKLYLKPGTLKYTSWMKEVSTVLANLGDAPPPGTLGEIEEVVGAISVVFSKTWQPIQ